MEAAVGGRAGTELSGMVGGAVVLGQRFNMLLDDGHWWGGYSGTGRQGQMGLQRCAVCGMHGA